MKYAVEMGSGTMIYQVKKMVQPFRSYADNKQRMCLNQ
jgi:hypothetical protein